MVATAIYFGRFRSFSVCAEGAKVKSRDGGARIMPASIDDPKVLEEIGGALKEKGIGA